MGYSGCFFGSEIRDDGFRVYFHRRPAFRFLAGFRGIGSDIKCHPVFGSEITHVRFSLELASRIWVVVKIMVPFWVPIIIRHLLFGVPKKGPSF